MRKTLIAILMALALVVIPVSSALAATTAGVSVTATPTFIGITNAPPSWNLGLITAGSHNNTGETNFTITNSSTVAIDTKIECSGWSGTNHWTYGAPAADTGELLASPGSGGYTITVPVNPPGPYAALHTNVAVGNNPQWGLQLEAPSSFGFGDAQSTTVTITAVAH